MSKRARLLILFATAAAFAFGLAAPASAHSGGTDKDGCHIEKKTGKRHCH